MGFPQELSQLSQHLRRLDTVYCTLQCTLQCTVQSSIHHVYVGCLGNRLGITSQPVKTKKDGYFQNGGIKTQQNRPIMHKSPKFLNLIGFVFQLVYHQDI